MKKLRRNSSEKNISTCPRSATVYFFGSLEKEERTVYEEYDSNVNIS